jgi:hypothetical protein
VAGPESNIIALVFLLLSFGSDSRDVVSYLNPDDYFAHRGVDVKVENLLSLAARSPASGKDQVRQLLAIRKLVADPAQARKDGRVRGLLTQIVEGKKGRDRLGFAEDYARRALARLDGKPIPTETIPKSSLRSDAFAWFPKEAAVVGGWDLRPVAGVPAADVKQLRALAARALKQAKPGEVGQLYDAVEKLGNLRLDRFSVGVAADRRGGDDSSQNLKIYVRCTGKVDHRRLVNVLEEAKLPVARLERDRGQEPVTYLGKIDQAPAFAVVGDTDLLIAGFTSDQGNQMALLEEMLETRARKRPSVLAGPLAARLKKASPQTFILLAGDLTRESGLGPLGALGFDGTEPLKTLQMEATRKAAGVDIAVDAVLESEGVAKRVADEASKNLREVVEDVRRQLKAKPEVPEETATLVTRTVESVKVKAKGTSLYLSVHVSNELLKAVPDLLGKLGVFPGGPQPEVQKEPGQVKPFKPAQPGKGQGALGPPAGAALWRVGMSPVTPWGRVAATAVPCLAATRARQAAPLVG